MARNLRIVNYAVNGGGVGHLTRLIGVNRWIRRYAQRLGINAEIYFLTTSDADGILHSERMAGFKIPSPSAARDSGIPRHTYLAMAKQWAWHSMTLLRPDILVVDTWPTGAYGELLGALDLCNKRAFMYRPVRDEVAQEPDFQAMLPLYDALLVPEYADTTQVLAPPEAQSAVQYLGPMMVRERGEQRSRIHAREQLGIFGERLAVYISAGGGGDPTAEDRLLSICATLVDDPDLHLVVGAGPLYRGRVLQGERITWLANGGASELLSGIDVAISGAGYNTFSELMHAGVPTIFLPQDKQADDQLARAQRAVDAGAASILDPPFFGARIEAALLPWKDAQRRAAASEAARRLVPQNHARDAAAALLKLVLPSDRVERAVASLHDTALQSCRDLNVADRQLSEVIRALEHRPEQPPQGDPERTTDLAIEVLEVMVQNAIARPDGIAALQVLGSKLNGADPEGRAAAARTLLIEFCPFNDWPGATNFLRLLPMLRSDDAEGYVGPVVQLLRRLRAEGADLYRGMQYLTHP